MAKYFRHDLTYVDGAPSVPMGPLKGGEIARSSRAFAVFNGLDEIPALGRRVLCSSGCWGSDAFASETISPSGGTSRIVSVTKAALTPGYMLTASCLYVPSGPVSSGESEGQITIDVTWTSYDGQTESTTSKMNLAGEDALPSPHALALRTKRLARITPQSLAAVATTREWSRHGTVEITVSYVGNPRVVDFSISEVPYMLACEADDDASFRVSGFYSGAQPDGGGPQPPIPLQRFSETSSDGDFRGGSWQILDQIQAQQKRFNSMIFQWTGYAEENASATAEGFVTVDQNTSTWVRIPDGATDTDPLVLAASDQPGWSLCSAAYSRPYNENHTYAMANNGAVRVRCGIRTDTDFADQDFEARIYSTDYSYISIEGTALQGDKQHTEKIGWLECGQGPGDFRSAKLLVRRRTGTTDDVRVYDFYCEQVEAENKQDLQFTNMVFHADALNDNSYPDTGTTMTELVQDDSGTMSNVTVDSSGNFNFNGTTSYVQWSANSAWEDLFDGGGTLAIIFRAETDGETSEGHIATTQESAGDTYGWALKTVNESGDNVDIQLTRDFDTAAGEWSITTTLNEWHCLIITYDGSSSSNDPTMYLDGASASVTEDTAPSGNATTDSGTNFALGNVSSGTTRTFDGDINVCVMYDTALSSTQASNLYRHFRATYDI